MESGIKFIMTYISITKSKNRKRNNKNCKQK